MAKARKTTAEQEAPNAAPRPAVSSKAPGKRRIEDRILNALSVIAELLVHDETYLPIFLRLEEELEKARMQQDALERARAFVRKRS